MREGEVVPSRRGAAVDGLVMTPSATLCLADGFEPIFRGLLASLLLEGFPPQGSIVDAGAQEGHEACLFATSAPHRTVHALDPSSTNVQAIHARYALHNLRPMRAGLGRKAEIGLRDPGGASHQIFGNRFERAAAAPRNRSHEDGGFDVHPLDALFDARNGTWRGEALALLHLDVNGGELDVLRGGERTIQRDRPVLATELDVHLSMSNTLSTFKFLRALDYVTFLIEHEVCGSRMDCRNLVHIPTERVRSRVAHSPAMTVALASGAVRVVNASMMASLAFPCCEPREACCPHAHDTRTCCSEAIVRAWIGAARDGAAAPPAGMDGNGTSSHIVWRTTPLFAAGREQMQARWRAFREWV